jgi:hypothetical protein
VAILHPRAIYAILAQKSLEAGKRRYPVYPKGHMLCHAALKLFRLSERCRCVLPPCQQQEDYIGKPSRISRKTNVRQAHRSILWRSMINITESLAQAEIDQRGKHAWLTDPCDIYASRSSEFQSYLFAFWLALAMFGSGSVRENRRWMKSADVDQLDRSKMEKMKGTPLVSKNHQNQKVTVFNKGAYFDVSMLVTIERLPLAQNRYQTG